MCVCVCAYQSLNYFLLKDSDVPKAHLTWPHLADLDNSQYDYRTFQTQNSYTTHGIIGMDGCPVGNSISPWTQNNNKTTHHREQLEHGCIRADATIQRINWSRSYNALLKQQAYSTIIGTRA